MDLERIIELMKSEDYKDRFKAEYYQIGRASCRERV